MRHIDKVIIDDMPYGPRFYLVSKAFRRKMDDNLKDYNLTAVQGAVLGTVNLFEKEGFEEVSQRDIERRMHTTHATLTEVLRKLEAAGFISMTRSDSDKRSKVIKTTSRAHELFNKIDESDKKIYEDMTAGISDAEMDSFWKTYARLVDNMNISTPEGGN